jgi:hypothetical protein
MPVPDTLMKPVSLPMFDINDALTPIDVRRILALLQIGLEGFGDDEAESTEREFYDALIEVPPC